MNALPIIPCYFIEVFRLVLLVSLVLTEFSINLIKFKLELLICILCGQYKLMCANTAQNFKQELN
jgi:hypothetical protein